MGRSTNTIMGKSTSMKIKSIAFFAAAALAWMNAQGDDAIIGRVPPMSGLATVTVSAAGKISGKFQEGGTNWTFSAASYTAATSAATPAGGCGC